nr:efflux RND transporter periplasmic adaptor subunit [Thermoguttaceae bacterium]
IGQKVKKGDVLAKLDPRDFELAVNQVNAGLGEANAALKAMKTGARSEDIEALEAKIEMEKSQLETAEKNEARFAKLIETKSVPQIKYDEIKLMRDKAKAALEADEKLMEKARKGSRDEEIEAMESKIAGLHVMLQKAENALADSVLVAPSDGCVSQKFLENGEIAAPGIPVLVFTDTNSIQVETTIPESVLLEQDRFESFTCEFEAYPGVKFEAKLHELGQALQTGKPGWPLTVEITTDDAHPVHPGMTATITIGIQSTADALIVPLAALVGTVQTEGEYQAKSEATHVWVVGEDSTVKARPVRIVGPTEKGMEIQGDLKPNEKIVSAGARFLHEGEKVRVQ